MSKEMDKALADHKKLQPQVKKFKEAQVIKLKKQVKDTLAVAWKAEDACTEALEAAQKNGITGKKVNDFLKDKGFKDALTAWKKMFEQHQGVSKEIASYCGDARELYKKLFAVQESVRKELKKPTDPAGKKFKETLTTEVADVKKVADVLGTMTAPELFYSSNFSRSVERLLKGADGGAKASSADATKLLEPKERVKNVKTAVRLMGDVDNLCDAAVDKAGDDPKGAVADLKKTTTPLKELEQLNKLYQAVKKKSANEIKAAKDKSKILKAINLIKSALDTALHRRVEAVKAVKKAAS